MLACFRWAGVLKDKNSVTFRNVSEKSGERSFSLKGAAAARVAASLSQ